MQRPCQQDEAFRVPVTESALFYDASDWGMCASLSGLRTA